MVRLGMCVCVSMYVFVYILIEFLSKLHHTWNVRGSQQRGRKISLLYAYIDVYITLYTMTLWC